MSATHRIAAVRPFGVRFLERAADRIGVLFLLALGVSTAGATILVGV